MTILAIDTTSEFGSLALARGAELLEVVSLHSRQGYAHLLFQHILDLLGRHGLELKDVEGYAAAAGPGSFTGVRVGLTAAKGLAEAHGRRVAPVSNLLALAFAGEGALRAPVLDARRGEIYGAVYDANLQPVIEEVVIPWPRFLERLGERGVTFVAADFDFVKAGIAGTRFESARVITVGRALAGAVAGVAARIFAAGRGLLPEQADANYVRRSDAELLWKEP
jgi:tRNA threonylcarbamoyladenosine biosynthesis protein TsaB